MSLSLMTCQMTRVISSPSSSTTGLATLILGMEGNLGALIGELLVCDLYSSAVRRLSLCGDGDATRYYLTGRQIAEGRAGTRHPATTTQPRGSEPCST